MDDLHNICKGVREVPPVKPYVLMEGVKLKIGYSGVPIEDFGRRERLQQVSNVTEQDEAFHLRGNGAGVALSYSPFQRIYVRLLAGIEVFRSNGYQELSPAMFLYDGLHRIA